MISVAIPTLNGAGTLEGVLAAVRAQTVEAELVVLDSGSTDATRAIAERFGAAVHLIADFGHGRARNRLMELTGGERVAFLTQDAVPSHPGWLAALLDAGAPLSYGPYAAPPGAGASLRREYAEFFPEGPRVFAAADLADPPVPEFATFVSSANLLLSRRAWTTVPFRDVHYAEDQWLGLDLLAAGMVKAYVPSAAVVHGHDYGPVERLRRYFDEFRALREVYDWTAPASPSVVLRTLRADVARDRAWGAGVPAAVAWHGARAVGAALGTRAGRLPAGVRRRLSLEGRA